jgi:Phage tail protein (Tail_P2_I)
MKHYSDYPSLSDTIVFNIETNNEGVIAAPYCVEKISIYYLEKSFKTNERTVEKKFYNPQLEEMFVKQQDIVKDNPDDKNIAVLRELNKRLEETAISSTVYYNKANLVMSTVSPLWVSGYQFNKINAAIDNTNKVIPGKFIFSWLPKGMREGNYIVRWDWRMSKDGPIKSAEKLFTILANEAPTTGVKLVPRDKYDYLLTKYIPLMYYRKTKINDLTPDVIRKLNKSIGQGFLEIEDAATNLFTMLDPINIREDLLPALSNFFGLTLHSDNSGAWRNQIKHSLALYRKKGTLEGLKSSLDKVGVKLIGLVNLWQIVSPYTWTDCFIVDKDEEEVVGYLSKKPLDLEEPDFEISIRSDDSGEYHVLPSSVITLEETFIPELRMAVIWRGSEENINLYKGDFVKIKYKYKQITDRTLENYIQNHLPLADKRDETKIKYPVKNWNVHLIEDNDPAFNLLIQERHPLANPVTFGKIRTTFMYSEKVFNMDTYNGSLYNSNNPCDMDKDFLDVCTGGQSSMFNIHLEMENATDEKIKDALDIIKDCSPFHAILNSIIINSKIIDLVLPPEETIKGSTKSKEKDKNGDKIQATESIFCEVRYKDGRKFQGRIV